MNNYGEGAPLRMSWEQKTKSRSLSTKHWNDCGVVFSPKGTKEELEETEHWQAFIQEFLLGGEDLRAEIFLPGTPHFFTLHT